MKLLKSVLILSALALFVFACTTSDTNTTQPENTNTTNANETADKATPTPDEMAQGQKLYKQNCARCHKDDGTGGKVDIEGKTLNVDDLTTEKMKKEPDEEYIEYMVKGIPSEGMPSFKDVLSDEEMKEVVKYIREEIQK